MPIELILDGQVQEKNLPSINRSKKWLLDQLRAGVYRVIANSAFAGETRPHTLRVEIAR